MVHLRARLAAFIRNARGSVPQRVFARKMGVAQSTIMRIENEDQNVTLDTLEQLCKVFQVDVGDLFPPKSVARVYPPSARVSDGRSPAMVHDSAARKGKPAKPGK
ncbi:MAG: helix-turn-helix transcriptional regulator [Pseudohongiella sp.]|uniref:helix-turn-helix domain-containing protein n=1 Tax=Pseudohongiella sp. TaxID=1979412 RepID=UPI00349FEFF6